MAKQKQLHGAVVPLVTPVTATGDLDEPALERLIDSQLAGHVEGIFVLGTTGEGPSVPRSFRRRMVECAVARAKGRTSVYAGIGDTCLPDSIAAANDFFQAGADAVVAHPPVYFPLQPQELTGWFRTLLDAADGPVIIYNIPSTTRVSIPLEVVASLVGHPRLAGIKDSENDAKRHEALLRQFGDQADFSIFIGVGVLMLQGLKLGADGIVPSAGNLVPDVCHRLCESARCGDWAASESLAERMNAVATLYQKGRTLGPSLAALKAALHLRGICSPHVLPPLLPLTPAELEALRTEMDRLRLLD
jgi:dihydrodipicolinate synthase/N-acetylneuraminate lyase